MHSRGVQSVSGHAEEADLAAFPRLEEGFQRPARAHRRLPFLLIHEGVHLPKVHVVSPEPGERTIQLLERARLEALLRLRGQENLVAARGEPGLHPNLGLAVAGGDVEVVDAGVEREAERPVGLSLRDGPERRGAEDQPR
jgi:hypothetical protein